VGVYEQDALVDVRVRQKERFARAGQAEVRRVWQGCEVHRRRANGAGGIQFYEGEE
jgi:hypothetical protein